MKILVTGSLGFIGSHLVDKLVDEGHEVAGIDDLSGGSWDNRNWNSKHFTLDLRDLEGTKYVVSQFKPEVIYHLAANAAESKAQFSPIDIASRTYNTFLNVLVAGLNNGMRRIVVASSAAVYGSAKEFKETTEPDPEDLYGLSKWTMEKSLAIMSKVHDFEYVVGRFHNVYGPRQSMRDPYRNVVMLWMNSLLHKEPYTIYGDGSMKRCYTYISDLVNGVAKLATANVAGEIFNLGADEPISLKQLSDAIQDVTSHALPPTFLPQRPQEVAFTIPNHDKAKELLKYKTEIDLITGIQRSWEWAKSKGTVEKIYTDFEIDSPKIPANWRK